MRDKASPHMNKQELHTASLLQKAHKRYQDAPVPEGYFAQLPQRIMDTLADAEIMEGKTLLQNISKNDLNTDPPEAYWTQLTQQVKTATSTEKPTRSLWGNNFYTWAVAASFIFLASLGLWQFWPQTSVSSSDMVAQMETEDLVAMAAYAGAMPEDVAEVFSLNDIEDLSIPGWEDTDTEGWMDALDMDEADILEALYEEPELFIN